VPTLVVKPRMVAGAYALRAQYRQGGTMAVFPAEMLVSLYRTLVDMRDVLVIASALNRAGVPGRAASLCHARQPPPPLRGAARRRCADDHASCRTGSSMASVNTPKSYRHFD
jgi:hypothetical protein